MAKTMVSLQARVPLLPPPSRVVSSPNSLPLPFRTPATRAIRVSAFATGLKKSPAYDLSQAQGRLLFCKIVHLLLFFFTPKLLNILPTTGAGDRGWRSGESTRPHPCGLGSTPDVGWVCCWFSPLLPAKGFSPGTLVSVRFSLKNLARTTWTSSGTVKPGLGETARISNLMNKTLLQGLCLYYQLWLYWG